VVRIAGLNSENGQLDHFAALRGEHDRELRAARVCNIFRVCIGFMMAESKVP